MAFLRARQVILLLSLTAVMALSSCMTYTYEDALQEIPAERSLLEEELPSTRKVVSDGEPEKMAPEIAEPEIAETPAIGGIERTITTIDVALVPLPCGGPEDLLDRIVDEVNSSSYDIVGFTGEEKSLSYVANRLSMRVHWTEQGLFIATELSVDLSATPFIQVETEMGRTVHVALVDIQESTVFDQLVVTPDQHDWQKIILESHEKRSEQVNYLLDYRGQDPLLVFASLGEPASTDWFETADGHHYRSRVAWPMVEDFSSKRFLDSWSMTHYSALASPGHTWTLVTPEVTYEERVDFLLSLGLLPVKTMVIPMGPWETSRFPYEYRSAITGTFVLP